MYSTGTSLTITGSILTVDLDWLDFSHLVVFTCSFPYESRVFPELSERGAFRKDMTYSRQVLDEIIEYAKARGIRLNAFYAFKAR